LGLIAPKDASASRSIIIEAPQEIVFNTVNDLTSWESWSPWKEMDPDMKVSMGEKTAGEGASYSWVGEKSGKGELTILESKAPESLATAINFDGQGTAQGSWLFESSEEGTKATWGLYTKFPFPFNAMLLFQDFEGAINKDFDRGLALLKEKIESQPTSESPFKIKEVELPIRHFIAIKETIPLDKVSEHYQVNLPKVYDAVNKAGFEMAGMPCGLFYTWDEEKGETIVAQSIPLKSAATLEGYTSIELPHTRALLIEYYGDYDGTGNAHEAMEAYIIANGIDADVPAIEEYVTDPTTEPDPNKWLTRVYYPLKS
jgi:effector-binding domain-containing protein